MKNFMLHRANVQTIADPQGDRLSSPLMAKRRPAARSREEVDEVLMPPASPDEANAGGLMEGQQAFDDDVSFFSGVSGGERNRHVDVTSMFWPLAAYEGAGVCRSLFIWPNVTIRQAHGGSFISSCDEFRDV